MARLPRLEPQVCCACPAHFFLFCPFSQHPSLHSQLQPQQGHPSHFCVLGFCTVHILWDGDPVPSWAPCPLSQNDPPLTSVFLPWAPGPGPEIKSLVRIAG